MACSTGARPPAIWGKATLAMAVSRSSMKVASVTVTAMIQGLIPASVAATFGKEMEPVVALIRCPVSWMQQETVRSHLNVWYNAISDQLVAGLVLRDLDAQRRADPPGNHSQGGAHLQ